MANAARTVVITGGAGHLGRAVARWWTTAGAHVVLIDKDEAKLAACAGELKLLGVGVTTLAVDLAQPTQLSSAVQSLPSSLWSAPLSLVVAHGIPGRQPGHTPRLGSLDPGDWHKVIEVNLTSAVFTIQTFLPHMKNGGGGRIVLVSSAAALSASPTAALSYSVSKAGIAALPRILAPELATAGVLINAIAPGKFANPDWPEDPLALARYEKSIPLGRVAEADEIAALIGFLGSEANTYVTGQTILQDGGRLSGAGLTTLHQP